MRLILRREKSEVTTATKEMFIFTTKKLRRTITHYRRTIGKNTKNTTKMQRRWGHLPQLPTQVRALATIADEMTKSDHPLIFRWSFGDLSADVNVVANVNKIPNDITRQPEVGIILKVLKTKVAKNSALIEILTFFIFSLRIIFLNFLFAIISYKVKKLLIKKSLNFFPEKAIFRVWNFMN